MCNGDLVLDGDAWRCWQCARYYYPKPAALGFLFESGAAGPPSLNEAQPGTAPGHRRSRERAPRGVDSVVAAKSRSDSRWRLRNGEIIRHLEEGRSVAEVALLVGRGQRQIRTVRERLEDLRDCKPDSVLG
jgi:hypothetical protein